MTPPARSLSRGAPHSPQPFDPRRYFGHGYYHLYKQFLLPPEQTGAEVDFLLHVLHPRVGQRWLDVPCAYGRHLPALKARRPRLRLVGLDLNIDYLREEGLGANAALCRGDFRRLPLADAAFHVVLNLLNSFGYYPPVGRMTQNIDDRGILHEWRRVLRPQGRLVMDLANRRALIDLVRRKPLIRYCGGDYEVSERFRWNSHTQCLENRTHWRWSEGVERAGYQLRLYTPAQLRRLLERAGFEVTAVYGDFDASDFNPVQSDRMIVLARKMG